MFLAWDSDKKDEDIGIYYSCMAFDMVGKQSLNPVLYGV